MGLFRRQTVAETAPKQTAPIILAERAIACLQEATGVEPRGRISRECLGLYSDANEAALARVLAAIRAHSPMPVAIQLSHAGRKGSSRAPWDGGTQIRAGEPQGWTTEALAHARAAADLARVALSDDGAIMEDCNSIWELLNPGTTVVGVPGIAELTQLSQQIPTQLSLDQSLLLVWPHIVILFALTIGCFALA